MSKGILSNAHAITLLYRAIILSENYLLLLPFGMLIILTQLTQTLTHIHVHREVQQEVTNDSCHIK